VLSGLQRLDPDEGGAMIVADPQLRGIYRFVDIHAADIRLGWQKIIDDSGESGEKIMWR
jgi:hypothetical protein